MAVQLNYSYGKLDFTSIPEEHRKLARHLMCNGFKDSEIKLIIDERLIDYKEMTESEYGKVYRKEKNKDKDNLFYHLLPYGMENGKIILPEYYHKFIDSDELVYNLCMVTMNFYFYFLLSFRQKCDIYKFIIENFDKRLFGYRESSATMETLYDNLNKHAFYMDKLCPLSVIKLFIYGKKYRASEELMQMLNQNLERDVIFNQYKWGIKEIISDDVIINNLKPYLPLLWFFNRENFVYKNIKSEDFLINGTPQIRTIRYPESPIC